MPSTARGVQFLQFPSAFPTILHQALSEGHSAAEAAIRLRNLGFAAGEGFYDALEQWQSEQNGKDLSTREISAFWQTVSDFFQQIGWGTLRHEQLHAGIAMLVAEDWAESRSRSGEIHPSCHLSTGIFSDLLSRVAGGDVAVLEIECVSAGGSECRFLLGSLSALEHVYHEMRDGRTYREAVDLL